MSQATPSPTLRRRTAASPALRHRTPLFAVVLGLLLALTFPGTAAFAQTAAPNPDTTVSWSVRPADTAQGSGRPNFAYELAPGGTVGDAMVVTNRSVGPITVNMYSADGFLTEDGSLDMLAGGETSTELGSWVDIAAAELTLESGQAVEVPFSVAVPADTPPGDYAAGIVASMLVTADTGTITERRLGSRINLRVLGDLVPALTVTDVAVAYHGTPNPIEAGSATVTYTVANTGNTRLSPDVAVSAAGPFGWAAVRASDEVPDLLPGSSMERTVELAGVPPLAVVTADVTATSTVVSPGVTTDAVLPEPVISTGSAATAAVPWTVLAILVALVALVLWRLRARKRAKVAHQRAIDEAVAAAKAERATEESTDAARPAAVDAEATVSSGAPSSSP